MTKSEKSLFISFIYITIIILMYICIYTYDEEEKILKNHTEFIKLDNVFKRIIIFSLPLVSVSTQDGK